MLSIDGLASGLDTSGLIEQLLSLQRRPVLVLQNQVATANQRQTALLDITARVLSLKTTVSKLADPDAFRGVSATSSNESVLAASVSSDVPPGVYSFRVGQLASSSQFVSRGFESANETTVGAGTLSLEYGGFVDVETELDELNGGTGVTRGKIRITDASGGSAVVDLGSAVTVRDVIDAINETSGIDITASIADGSFAQPGRGLVLIDDSGGTGSIEVEEVGGTDTAADLGLLGQGSSTELEGTAIRTLGPSTRLSTLSDGLGLRGGAGDDIRISATALASDLLVDVDSLTTVQDLLDAVNDHANNDGSIVLRINDAQDGFTLEDVSATGGLTVSDEGLGKAASDLGLAGVTAGTSIDGERRLAGIDDILLSSLGGTFGLGALTTLTIQDRASTSATSIDLSSAQTLQDVIRAINDSSADVTASIDPRGNALSIRDHSGGTGDLTIGGAAATELGIAGTVSGNTYSGSDLDPRYIHANTRLDTLNGGAGVSAGSIRITSTSGATVTVNLSNAEDMGDVVRNIQAQGAAVFGSGFSVGYNDEGNGLVITDTSGSGLLRIDEVGGGTTARDLHLLGVADASSPTTINGAFEETITIEDTDTLEDVLAKIEATNIAVTAAVLDDGSAAGNRLSVIGDRSGRQGRLLIETGGGTNLSFDRTSQSRDAILFYGESTSASESILLRSSSNTYENVIDGLTVTALTTSASPVSVTVNRDHDALEGRVGKFVDDFNSILSVIDDLTGFDVETEERGLLLGDSALRNAERQLFNGVIRPLNGVDNPLRLLSEVGIRVVNGRLSFDSSEFKAALEDDPSAVERLFTAARPLEDRSELADFRNGAGVDVDSAGDDFEIHLRDGTTLGVDISGAVYAEDIIDRINDAATTAGVTLTAELSSATNSFVLRDGTSGSETFRVTSAGGSSAANDLGLNRSADVDGGGVLTGFEVDLTEDPGIGSRLVDIIDGLTDTDDGALQRRADRFDELIADLESRIQSMNDRIGRREDQLRRQFAQLEQVIQSSQNTQQRLAAQLSTLGGA
ncbi:MAG: flagellar filament capping protein FliD [Planctomycetes bacterium]|nr:flagellar filament capping protein FliD [Planctomycetota bacterium]